MVFQQKLLEKAYFNVEMTGPAMVRPATQFWLLESAFSIVSNDDWLKMITSENNNLWCGVLTAKLKLPFIDVEYIKPFIKGYIDLSRTVVVCNG